MGHWWVIDSNPRPSDPLQQRPLYMTRDQCLKITVMQNSISARVIFYEWIKQ